MEPRGMRNNNPGNIRTTKDRWQGLRPQQTDPAFFQFTEMRYGYRALIITLQNYRRKHGCRTVADFIRLKSDPEYYNDPVCQHGYLRGSETFNYVREIMQRYHEYCLAREPSAAQ